MICGTLPHAFLFKQSKTYPPKLVARFDGWAVLPRKKYGITDLLVDAFLMEDICLTEKSARNKQQKLGAFLMEWHPQSSLKLGYLLKSSQKSSLIWNL